MPKLNLHADLGPEVDATIAVRIVNLDRKARRKPKMVPLNTRSLTGHDVESGRYLVETVLPNGEKVSRTVDLEAEAQTVDLSPELRSPGAALNTAVATRPIVGLALRSDTKDPGRLFVRCLDRDSDGTWTPSSLETIGPPMRVEWLSPEATDGLVARVELPPRRFVRALAVGGPKVPVRSILVPPYVPMRAVLFPRPAGAPGPRNKPDPLCVSMVTLNASFEGLMAYQSAGQYEAARTISQDVAERLLGEKEADPVAATGGAYAMLKTGRITNVLEWLGNLADGFPALPDAYLLLAAVSQNPSVPVSRIRQLRFAKDLVLPSGLSDEELRQTCSIHLLGAAYDSGIPLFTEGLRLHLDLLDALDEPLGDKRFDTAWHAVRNVPTLRRKSKPWKWAKTMWRWLSLGKVADWNSRFLTLYVEDPGRTTTRRVFWQDPPDGALERPD
ncbi:MAG: hypothetical protein JST30_07565 [Armatimonadetes bacterium]|nr:hypothetical protein [Armatimonadota bacterium]